MRSTSVKRVDLEFILDKGRAIMWSKFGGNGQGSFGPQSKDFPGISSCDIEQVISSLQLSVK